MSLIQLKNFEWTTLGTVSHWKISHFTDQFLICWTAILYSVRHAERNFNVKKLGLVYDAFQKTFLLDELKCINIILRGVTGFFVWTYSTRSKVGFMWFEKSCLNLSERVQIKNCETHSFGPSNLIFKIKLLPRSSIQD